jgi:hypothetical protein
MKRYRILSFDLDTRATFLSMKIQDKRIAQGLLEEYGSHLAELKLQNFIELGPMPISILAFHNEFLHQVRTAFVMGAYYPALTAACALGERILNRLILLLRDDFAETPEYKRVYKKDSFDNWNLAISTLNSWGVLRPEAVDTFKKLSSIRNRTIHFNPETDKNAPALALEAIRLLNTIIEVQFSAFGPLPWFIVEIRGECYIKKEAERLPFVQKVYLPKCCLVGPRHSLEFDQTKFRFIVHDNFEYDEREISDTEFAALREQSNAG